MIEFCAVGKSYSDNIVLQDFCAKFDIGTTCIMGASGSGKTTILRLLLGLDSIDSGEIEGLTGLRYACVFQEDRLLDNMSSIKNIIAINGSASRDRAISIMNEIGLGDSINSKVSTLSGGMKRRVALVRAIVRDADVYVFDEPFNGLDEISHAIVANAIKKYTANKIAIIVTHDIRDALILDATVINIDKTN